jgi:Fe-S cluster assembly protein SufD
MNALLDEFGIGTDRERDESWRYSRSALRALEQQEFAAASSDATLDAALIAQFDWPETRGSRMVFVNGGLSEKYADLATLGSHVSSDADLEKTSITIRAESSQPIHIVFVNVAGDKASRWRRVVDIHASMSATVIEQHIGAKGFDVLGSVESNVRVDSGATLTMVTMNDVADSVSHYRRLDAKIGAGATLSTTHVLAGGRLQRFDIAPDIAAANARFVGRGVFALSGRQHVDVHLDARHSARDTASDVSWRGIADGRSRGILRGAITVAAGADGSDAQLQTKNILLSANAEIDAQPVLEIYADEVKASHGATVGQLDERALFYLRSRGITRDDARSMLIAGFAREAFDSVTPAIRERLDAWLARHLTQSVCA